MNIDDLDSKLRGKILDAFLDDEKQIGDYSFSEEDRITLKEFCFSIKDKKNWSCEESEIVTAFLVSVVKNYKGEWSGKEFWNRVYPYVGWRPGYEYELRLIGEALTRNGRPLFVTSGNTHRYVESLSYQAYSPQTSVKSFIKLAWSLYTNPDVFDFAFFDSESDGNLCLAIIESLDSHYRDMDYDADFTFESATYSIRAGLRYAFAQDKKGAVRILRRVLRYIDWIYQHREKVDEEKEGYLARLCNECVPKLIASYDSVPKTTSSIRSRETVDDIDKIKASYILQNSALFIYFPKIRLYKENQQFKKAKISIYLSVDGNLMPLDKREYECVGEDYKHALREVYFPIQNHLSFFGEDINIVATLSFDDNEPVYDSKRSLFRKFIVFKDETESKSSLLTSSNYRLVHPINFSLKDNVHSSEEPHILSDQLFEVYFNDGDRVSFNGAYVFFGQKETGGHFLFDDKGTREIKDLIIKGKSSESYRVFKEIGNFVVRSDELVKAECLDIQLLSDDGDLIDHFPLSSIDSDKGVYCFPLEQNLKELASKGKRLLILALKDQSKDKYIYTEHVCLLSDILIQQGQTPYSNKAKSITRVSFLDANYEVENPPQTEAVSFETKLGTAEVRVPFFSWKINQNNLRWNPISESLPVLPDRFQSNDILFINSYFDNVELYCGNVEISESTHKGQFLIGQFCKSKLGHQAFVKGESIFAVVKQDGEYEKLPLFSLTQEPYFIDKTFESFASFDDPVLTIGLNGNFYGPSDSRFKVILEGQNSDDGNIEEIGTLSEDIKIKINSADIYDLSIYFQGPLDKKDYWSLVWSDEVELGDLNAIRFAGISRITISKISRCKVQNIFMTNIKYVGDEGFGPEYTGKIHYDTNNEKCHFIVNEGTNFGASSIPIVGLFFISNEEMYEFSFDSKKRKLSKHPVDNEIYQECLSIYAKVE